MLFFFSLFNLNCSDQLINCSQISQLLLQIETFKLPSFYCMFGAVLGGGEVKRAGQPQNNVSE